MRILIDDHEREVYPLPWDSDGTWYNFKAPDRRIHLDNLDAIKRPSYVKTLVVGCNLPDYRFISRMKNIEQLYIYDGDSIVDLSFLETLVKLKQLCVIGTHVESLESIRRLIERKYELYKAIPEEKELQGRLTYGFEGICITSDAYDSDGSDLLKPDISTSDIIVNKNQITFKDVMRNQKYRDILCGEK